MQESGQVFEVYSSRKEFAEMVKMLDWDNDGLWYDDDSSLTLTYADGTKANYQYGDKKMPLRLSQIVAGRYSNSATEAIYNYRIVRNDCYDDYEAVK
jgi:hypothetical protein